MKQVERRALFAALTAAAGALLVAGCALDWSATTGAAEAFSGEGGLADHAEGAAQDGRAPPPPATPDSGATVLDAGAPAFDAASGGCRRNGDCATGEYCHFADHLCGQGAAGSCDPMPASSSCAGGPWPCTCVNDVDTGGECAAESKGHDVSMLSWCRSQTTVPGAMCGYVWCVTSCVSYDGGRGETKYTCT